jgi:HSP20 family molecular chaperone IbpA
MDEMFARLFSRMAREFLDSPSQGYGFRFIVRDNGDGPEMQEIANDAAPPPPITGEPMAEVHRTGNEVNVIADLPGIMEEALRQDVKGSTLVIGAGDADPYYHASAALPPADTASKQKTLKNGVPEVTFKSLPGPVRKVLIFRKTHRVTLFSLVTGVFQTGIPLFPDTGNRSIRIILITIAIKRLPNPGILLGIR